MFLGRPFRACESGAAWSQGGALGWIGARLQRWTRQSLLTMPLPTLRSPGSARVSRAVLGVSPSTSSTSNVPLRSILSARRRLVHPGRVRSPKPAAPLRGSLAPPNPHPETPETDTGLYFLRVRFQNMGIHIAYALKKSLHFAVVFLCRDALRSGIRSRTRFDAQTGRARRAGRAVRV